MPPTAPAPRAPAYLSALLVRWGPWFVPLIYLGAVLALQPADHLGDPDRAPWLGRLLHDDYDTAARALRGLNATLGRRPGRLDEPPRRTEDEFCRALDRDEPCGPDDGPYFLEYPQAALLLFRLGYLGLEVPRVPRAVGDALQHNLVEHLPRNDEERAVWRLLRRASCVYEVVGTVCLLALMGVLAWGYEPSLAAGPRLFLLVLPASLYFAVNRFDVVPTLFTALGLAALGQRRPGASAVLLGVATMLKVYPVLLAPLVVRYLGPNRRTVLAWVAAYGATLAGFLVPSLLLAGWDATWAPYRFQLGRALEGWTMYGYLLPPFLGFPGLAGSAFRQGCVLAVLGVLLRRPPAGLADLLRRGAVVLIVFLALQVFYSPQWILWLAPLLVPLAGFSPRLLGLAVALDCITYLSFPVVYDLPDGWPELVFRIMLVYARFLVFGGLLLVLVRMGRDGVLSHPASGSVPSPAVAPGATAGFGPAG